MPQKLHSVTEVATSGRSTSSVVRHVASLSKGVRQCGPFLLTDKLTTTLQLVSTFSFPYAVAVRDSSLRLPENRGLVNRFTAPGVGFTRWDWKEMMNCDRFTYILRQAGLPQT